MSFFIFSNNSSIFPSLALNFGIRNYNLLPPVKTALGADVMQKNLIATRTAFNQIRGGKFHIDGPPSAGPRF
jgi:hypothetical protein